MGVKEVGDEVGSGIGDSRDECKGTAEEEGWGGVEEDRDEAGQT